MTITAEQLDECLPKKWEVQSSLGKGGQGAVFLGAVSGTPAAIKLFHDTEDTKRVGDKSIALRTFVPDPSLQRTGGLADAKAVCALAESVLKHARENF